MYVVINPATWQHLMTQTYINKAYILFLSEDKVEDKAYGGEGNPNRGQD